MKSWNINWPRSRIRAISPVIATVLMIGLVVVAGLGVALVIFGTAATPAPIGVDVLGISEFETTDNDILVDRFLVTLENTERSNVLIRRADAFEVYLNGSIAPGWRLDLTQDQILISAFEVIDLHIAVDRSDPNATQLVPENDTIYVYVTVYPEGSKFTEREAKTFQSDLLAVEDTFGPVYLTIQTPSSDFGVTGLNLSMIIVNNGSTNLDLLLEFTALPSSFFFITINGINQSLHTFTLQKYHTTSLQGVNITATPFPAQVTSGNLYSFFIVLMDKNTFKVWAIMTLFATYQS